MGQKYLVVEGTDDEFFFKNLLGKLDLGRLDKFPQLKSVNNLQPFLRETLEVSDLDALGIVVDADSSSAKRWKTIASVLKEFDYEHVPDTIPKAGFVTERPPNLKRVVPKRVGAWIMPDNELTGTLESLLREMVDNTSRPLMEHATSVVDSIPQGLVRFPRERVPKAVIHTYLAWQKEPGKPIGQAVMANYLTSKAMAVTALTEWLRNLFQLSLPGVP